jgi:hypothetical protein
MLLAEPLVIRLIIVLLGLLAVFLAIHLIQRSVTQRVEDSTGGSSPIRYTAGKVQESRTGIVIDLHITVGGTSDDTVCLSKSCG